MFKRWIRRAHLVLGLASGLVVLVLGVTGCILAFEKELRDLTEPYRFAPATETPLPPSALMRAAQRAVPGKRPSAVYYYAPGRAATVEFYRHEDGRDEYWVEVFLDPASGRVLRAADRRNEFNFLKFAMDGHTRFWLPEAIGHVVISYATLTFVILLLTGIVLWWPRHRSALRQRLAVKWRTGWKRRRYDLHAVLGFYGSIVALCIALTGLTWSFEWFSDAVYRVVSGGRHPVPWTDAGSDTAAAAGALPVAAAMDSVWRLTRAIPGTVTSGIRVPQTPDAAITAYAYLDSSVYYRTDYLYFDQYTLREIPVRHEWGRYEKSTRAGKLQRMYYDIHIGAILGFPGRILAFLAALIAASLPVTGFLMWRSRNKKKPKPESSQKRISP